MQSMRMFGYSLAGLLITLVTALGQNGVPPAGEKVETVLGRWEKAISELKSFACVIERTSYDPTFKSNDEYKGYALFEKAAHKNAENRARLDLEKVTNPKVFERFIYSGTNLYEYAPASSVVRLHKLPNAKQAGLPEENILSFLFGVGAEHAKARFNMEFDPKTPNDANYLYILIQPKPGPGARDFEKAQLVLYRSNYLPARVSYIQNGTVNTWNFTKLQIDVKIPKEHFTPEVPTGWKLVPVQAPQLLPKKMP